MNELFQVHNQHIKGRQFYLDNDPQLKKLKSVAYVYWPALLEDFIQLIPGIYTLTGGRQIGKSTLLKQWICQLLGQNQLPEGIVYLTGELINNHKELVKIVNDFLEKTGEMDQRYLIIDEVTYINQWDQGIKFLADAGMLTNVILMITGSDSSIIREARKRFPGRRGNADRVNFDFHPLSFQETIHLKTSKNIELNQDQLVKLFTEYLLHGGFLTAIDDLSRRGEILPATYHTYAEWIVGDMEKRGKQESYLLELIRGIFKKYSDQITWNSLAKELSIDHHKTISDYVHLLQDLDVLFIQQAVVEDKLVAAPKKAKKIFFKDPFIFHSLNHLVSAKAEGDTPFRRAQQIMQNSNYISNLIEQVAVCFVERQYPGKTFFIKAEGEVDIAYIEGQKLYPVEVKWTEQIRSKDLKQIRKYPQGQIWGKFEDLSAQPAVLDLIKILASKILL